MNNIVEKLYPESKIGGFSRLNHRVTFFVRVNYLLRKDMNVLNFGAGRDKWDEIETGYLRQLTNLKGKCKNIVGVDVDDAIFKNKNIDSAFQIKPSDKLPFEDNEFDLILSWAVFEHIEDPEFYAGEFKRILKPGGWLCAWTPNKWSYFALGARIIPTKLHKKLLKFLTPERKAEDIFDTHYKINTLNVLKRYFPVKQFEHSSYIHSAEPSYNANKMIIARLWLFYDWILPSAFGQMLHIFIRKK